MLRNCGFFFQIFFGFFYEYYSPRSNIIVLSILRSERMNIVMRGAGLHGVDRFAACGVVTAEVGRGAALDALELCAEVGRARISQPFGYLAQRQGAVLQQLLGAFDLLQYEVSFDGASADRGEELAERTVIMAHAADDLLREVVFHAAAACQLDYGRAEPLGQLLARIVYEHEPYLFETAAYGFDLPSGDYALDRRRSERDVDLRIPLLGKQRTYGHDAARADHVAYAQRRVRRGGRRESIFTVGHDANIRNKPRNVKPRAQCTVCGADVAIFARKYNMGPVYGVYIA